MKNLINRIKLLEAKLSNTDDLIVVVIDDNYRINGEHLTKEQFDTKYPKYRESETNTLKVIWIE